MAAFGARLMRAGSGPFAPATEPANASTLGLITISPRPGQWGDECPRGRETFDLMMAWECAQGPRMERAR